MDEGRKSPPPARLPVSPNPPAFTVYSRPTTPPALPATFNRPRLHGYVMDKLVSYVAWPALAGLVLAGVLLLAPHAARQIPALAAYLPQAEVAPPPQPATLSFSSAIKTALPAVVSINNQETLPQAVLTLRGIGVRDYEKNSLGSGVILNQEGFIITSYHVMSDPAVRYRFD